MTIGWNVLGIVAWLLIVLYLVFIIQNIRSRHLVMIVRDRKRFDWKTILVDVLEIALLILAGGYMLFLTFFNNPSLDDKKVISSEIDYQPLILTTGNKRSYYVTAESNNTTSSVQTYKFYSNGNSYLVSSNNATVSDSKDPMSVEASAIPFSKKECLFLMFPTYRHRQKHMIYISRLIRMMPLYVPQKMKKLNFTAEESIPQAISLRSF